MPRVVHDFGTVWRLSGGGVSRPASLPLDAVFDWELFPPHSCGRGRSVIPPGGSRRSAEDAVVRLVKRR
jgi:hypothetical protein